MNTGSEWVDGACKRSCRCSNGDFSTHSPKGVRAGDEKWTNEHHAAERTERCSSFLLVSSLHSNYIYRYVDCAALSSLAVVCCWLRDGIGAKFIARYRNSQLSTFSTVQSLLPSLITVTHWAICHVWLCIWLSILLSDFFMNSFLCHWIYLPVIYLIIGRLCPKLGRY